MNPSEIIPLLKKYGIVLIVFSIASRLLTSMVTTLLFRNFAHPIPGNPRQMITNSFFYMPLISGGIAIAINLVVAIIMLTDMDRNKALTWVIFVLALFNPWGGVLFLLAWKLAETQPGDRGLVDAENID